MKRFFWRALLILVLLYAAATAYRFWSRKYYVWAPDYIRWSMAPAEAVTGPVHVMFFYTDHFEPGENVDRTLRWEHAYAPLAGRHRDSSGRVLQHTWFYPGEQLINGNLASLARLAAGGYGEVELHYHHHDDTNASTEAKFREAIAAFQKFGFLKSADGRTQFAFIHGDWGLDNSLGPKFCGADRELELLRKLGAFADFTFASLWNDAQPSLVNSIFAATDDDRPKSYDRGTAFRVGQQVQGDLTIFEGPLVVAPSSNWKRLFWEVEDADIHPAIPTTPARADLWVKADIHVAGRPEWIFVKVFGHSASSDADMNETLGPNFENTLHYMETHYNDGTRYVLHYVTAREAYNVARAAAAGKQGDPRQYFDWLVPPYEANRPATALTASSPGKTP
ncbi:MAG TPA: hypothetical protein VK687_03145 [Bryobacteraceae bacterium]|jgi:hypothetical protein|nr:hypothetical protein [Bryobacteraceae bacterium]